MAFGSTSAVGGHVFGPRGSGVEHFLGKEGVTGSNPVVGSRLDGFGSDGLGNGSAVKAKADRATGGHPHPTSTLQVEHPCRVSRQRDRLSGEASEDHGEGKV